MPRSHGHAARLLIVSNRLPVTVEVSGGTPALRPSAGGLATGLRRLHDGGDVRWVGWPGALDEVASRRRAEIERELATGRMVPVWLTAEEISHYYEGVANGVLWPLFHYL